MKRHGILLLSFPFISEGFSVEFIATKYGEIVSKLGIRDASWSLSIIVSRGCTCASGVLQNDLKGL